MKWSDWLENWGMTGLKIQLPFLEMDWQPQDADRAAAWELYIELLTRVATQPLAETQGDEQAALDSLYSLFPTTRAVIKHHGRGCMEFSKLAIVVLNQVVRPFTASWHPVSRAGGFSNPDECLRFRLELQELQQTLVRYTGMLGEMAGIEEDLTVLEIRSC